MVKQLLPGVLLILLLFSCSDSQEGYLGEWEGTTNRINSNGNLIEVDISCVINASDGDKRTLDLSVGGANFQFTAIEYLDELIYTDKALNSDSIIINYISGSAEILNDTMLHFDHEIYALKNEALLNTRREELYMVRK